MYIKKIENWSHEDWRIFFQQFWWINNLEKEAIKKILTRDTKQEIEKDFKILKRYWVVNGIWPGYLWKAMRNIITYLFKGVKSDWHDINYAIWGNFWDRLRADWGLLKYSIISIFQIYRTIYFFEINPISKLLILLIFSIISVPIQVLIAVFCFIMVFLFGWFGSFYYHKR